MHPTPQIIILDAGGQYCHLEARKVRDLGVYAEVRPCETPAAELAFAKGIIISGGPSSVLDPDSPTVDPGIFQYGQPVLGICYGQQLMAHLLGGKVRKNEKGEYGLATLELDDTADPLFGGLAGAQQIWMSHRDSVGALPAGLLGGGPHQHLRGGRHRRARAQALRRPVPSRGGPHHARQGVSSSNFVFEVCGCLPDWDPRHRVPLIEQEIREAAGDRSVFFFVSGGVDSTVAFALCTRALGAERVRGVYVDTGLMREGETDFVRRDGRASRSSTPRSSSSPRWRA